MSKKDKKIILIAQCPPLCGVVPNIFSTIG